MGCFIILSCKSIFPNYKYSKIVDGILIHSSLGIKNGERNVVIDLHEDQIYFIPKKFIINDKDSLNIKPNAKIYILETCSDKTIRALMSGSVYNVLDEEENFIAFIEQKMLITPGIQGGHVSKRAGRKDNLYFSFYGRKWTKVELYIEYKFIELVT